MTTYVTMNLYTSQGQNHIFTVASDDSGFDEMTDVITGSGLGSLQGQTITKLMAWTDNYVVQGNGIVIVDPQNTPIASLPVTRIEMNQPEWQMVNIGPLNLNWVMKVNTSATVA